MPTEAQLRRLAMGDQPSYSGGGYGYRPGSRLIDLIMERGRIGAESAQQYGNIWANTLSNVGQTIGAGIAQHGEEKKKKTRDDAYLAIINDPKAMEDPRYAHQQFLRVGGPEDGSRMFAAYAGGLQLLQPNRDPEKDQKGAAAAINGMRGIKDLEKRGQVWSTLSPPASKVFGAQLPQQYDDEFFNKVLVPWADSLSGPAKLTPVPQGTTLVNEQTKEPVYTNPAAPPKPPAPPSAGSFEDYMTTTPERRKEIEAARKGYQQADDRPRITVNTGSALTPTAESNIVNRLSNQYTKASSSVAEITRQSKLMDAGLEAARKGDMAAGSQAVLVTFQKILDPTSVVRESEYARSAEGQSLLARAEGAFDRLTQGGAGVPLSELEKFKSLADDIVRQSTGRLDSVRKRIKATADRYKIPHELVVDDYDFAAAPAGTQSRGGPAQPKSKAEYDKLPSGAPYIAPDGSMRRKP